MSLYTTYAKKIYRHLFYMISKIRFILSSNVELNFEIGFYAGENVQATRWLSYKRKNIFG